MDIISNNHKRKYNSDTNIGQYKKLRSYRDIQFFLNNTNSLFKKTISVNCINGTKDISYDENSDIKDNIESLMNELDMLKL